MIALLQLKLWAGKDGDVMLYSLAKGKKLLLYYFWPLMWIAPLGGRWYYSIWKEQMMRLKILVLTRVKFKNKWKNSFTKYIIVHARMSSVKI